MVELLLMLNGERPPGVLVSVLFIILLDFCHSAAWIHCKIVAK